MAEILHAWALAPAAVGTCCLAAEGRRARMPELAASVLMLLAMMDAARPASLVAPVFWTALLLAAALALAALRGPRRAGSAGPTSTQSEPTVHTAVGLVVMGALLVGMGHADASAGAHEHGGPALAGVLLVGGTAYALAAAVAALRAHGLLGRAQHLGMAASTALMSLALLR